MHRPALSVPQLQVVQMNISKQSEHPGVQRTQAGDPEWNEGVNPGPNGATGCKASISEATV